ncbi:hypothetical protein NH340_JMT05628 [Sarcoptes scabiei]|nr:hypothetical protein NH340_JMT05628 [Sarcoptes scabiei]
MTTDSAGQDSNKFGNFNTISNVAEIFHAAGYAFKKLSELIQSMDSSTLNEKINLNGNNSNNPDNIENNFESHWDQADIEHFSSIVNNFTQDLNQLSMNLKNKMANRLKNEHSETKIKSLTEEEQNILALKEEA